MAGKENICINTKQEYVNFKFSNGWRSCKLRLVTISLGKIQFTKSQRNTDKTYSINNIGRTHCRRYIEAELLQLHKNRHGTRTNYGISSNTSHAELNPSANKQSKTNLVLYQWIPSETLPVEEGGIDIPSRREDSATCCDLILIRDPLPQRRRPTMAASVGGARGGVRPAPRRRTLRQSSPPPPPPPAALAVEFAPPRNWEWAGALVG